ESCRLWSSSFYIFHVTAGTVYVLTTSTSIGIAVLRAAAHITELRRIIVLVIHANNASK
ncbi:unnamed protein product, partial [Amoebophrya sp. A25]